MWAGAWGRACGGKGTASSTFSSWRRSFLVARPRIWSWSRWFSCCSECRDCSISTTTGGEGWGRAAGKTEEPSLDWNPSAFSERNPRGRMSVVVRCACLCMRPFPMLEHSWLISDQSGHLFPDVFRESNALFCSLSLSLSLQSLQRSNLTHSPFNRPL